MKINRKTVEQYFNENGYPDYDVEMDGSIIRKENSKKFVESSLNILKAHPLNTGYMPYWDALKKYFLIIIKNKKDERKN